MGSSVHSMPVVRLHNDPSRPLFTSITPPWNAYFLAKENGPPKEEDAGAGTSATFTKHGASWYPHGGHTWGQHTQGGPLGMICDFMRGPDPSLSYPDGPHVLHPNGDVVPNLTPGIVARFDVIQNRWISIALRSNLPEFVGVLGWSDHFGTLLVQTSRHGVSYDGKICTWDGTQAGWAKRVQVAEMPAQYATGIANAGSAVEYRLKGEPQRAGFCPLYVRHRREWWFCLLGDSAFNTYVSVHNDRIFGWSEITGEWFTVKKSPEIAARMQAAGTPANLQLVEDPWRQCVYATQCLSKTPQAWSAAKLYLVEGRGDRWSEIGYTQEAPPHHFMMNNVPAGVVQWQMGCIESGKILNVDASEYSDHYTYVKSQFDGRQRGLRIMQIAVGRGYQLTEFTGDAQDTYHMFQGKQHRFVWDTRRNRAVITDGDIRRLLVDGIEYGVILGGVYEFDPFAGTWHQAYKHGSIASGVAGASSGETSVVYIEKHDLIYKFAGPGFQREIGVTCPNGSSTFTLTDPQLIEQIQNNTRYFWIDAATPPSPFRHGVAYRVVQSGWVSSGKGSPTFKLADWSDTTQTSITVTSQGELGTWARLCRVMGTIPGEDRNIMGWPGAVSPKNDACARLGNGPTYFDRRDGNWHDSRRKVQRGPRYVNPGMSSSNCWQGYYDPVENCVVRLINAGALMLEKTSFKEWDNRLVVERFYCHLVSSDDPAGAAGRYVGNEDSPLQNKCGWDPVNGRIFVTNSAVDANGNVNNTRGPYYSYIVFTREADLYDDPKYGWSTRVHSLPHRTGVWLAGGSYAENTQIGYFDSMLWVSVSVNVSDPYTRNPNEPTGLTGHAPTGYNRVWTLDLENLTAGWVERTTSFPVNPKGSNAVAYTGHQLVELGGRGLMWYGSAYEGDRSMLQPVKWYVLTRRTS